MRGTCSVSHQFSAPRMDNDTCHAATNRNTPTNRNAKPITSRKATKAVVCQGRRLNDALGPPSTRMTAAGKEQVGTAEDTRPASLLRTRVVDLVARHRPQISGQPISLDLESSSFCELPCARRGIFPTTASQSGTKPLMLATSMADGHRLCRPHVVIHTDCNRKCGMKPNTGPVRDRDCTPPATVCSAVGSPEPLPDGRT